MLAHRASHAAGPTGIEGSSELVPVAIWIVSAPVPRSKLTPLTALVRTTVSSFAVPRTTSVFSSASRSIWSLPVSVTVSVPEPRSMVVPLRLSPLKVMLSAPVEPSTVSTFRKSRPNAPAT